MCVTLWHQNFNRSLSAFCELNFFLLHTAEEKEDEEEFDISGEPQALTPGTQSAQFAERFDRWLHNLRQQQLRLFSSCTSRVGNVENEHENDAGAEINPDPNLDSQPEPAINVSKLNYLSNVASFCIHCILYETI